MHHLLQPATYYALLNKTTIHAILNRQVFKDGGGDDRSDHGYTSNWTAKYYN